MGVGPDAVLRTIIVSSQEGRGPQGSGPSLRSGGMGKTSVTEGGSSGVIFFSGKGDELCLGCAKAHGEA